MMSSKTSSRPLQDVFKNEKMPNKVNNDNNLEEYACWVINTPEKSVDRLCFSLFAVVGQDANSIAELRSLSDNLGTY